MDARLLTHYFTRPEAGDLAEGQRVAISGYAGLQAFVDAAKQSQRADPVRGRMDIEGYASAVWHESVPPPLRYHPSDNPKGARPTVFDVARNIYGVDPETGFALRPFDNVGVQYGLEALNDGTVSARQFLELNERIGGFDHDSNYRSARSLGDVSAIKRTYQSGVTLGGGGGLAAIPVMDVGRYNELDRYHYQWFHFAVRERMRRQNGQADNHIMCQQQAHRRRRWLLLGVGWWGGGAVRRRAPDLWQTTRLDVQHAVPVVLVRAAGRWRAARRQRAQVSAEAHRAEGLCGRVHRP
jgi:hypothetical protein